MRLFLLFTCCLFLSGCAVSERHFIINAEKDSIVNVGDISPVVEVIKGDEELSNSPDITPSFEIPMLP